MTKQLAIICEPISDPAREWLAARCEVLEAGVSSVEFANSCQNAVALVVRTYTQVDAALLERMPALRVVGRAGVGTDNIDLVAARARGIQVVSTPDANTQAVVEYVVCLWADALRPRLYLDKVLGKEAWDQARVDVQATWQMDELQLGVLGLGRIGRRVAQVAAAIGFEVVYHDLLEIELSQRHGARPVSACELFAESDVITVHIDGRASNRGFVSRGLINTMRPDAVLINTSRGMAVDHAALAEFLRLNPAAMAILDVHDPEPICAGNPLLGVLNAHLAPHLASRTASAMEAMSWVVRDVVAVLSGKPGKMPRLR